MDKKSQILYFIGIILVFFGYFSLITEKGSEKVYMPSILLGSLFILISVVFAVAEREGYFPYEYPNAYKTGQVYGGAVYTKYPQIVPGLGWIL